MKYNSILQNDDTACWLCGRYIAAGGDWHHVFNAANKKRSERYGLMVKLCRECHDELHAGKHGQMAALKKRVQREAMQHYGWSAQQFITLFGKSYL
ncbi:MAG: hypothetical protein IJ168_07995 [Eubacterium sp.]|nr:hypothetical protein [Eubacterium sp.]